MTHRFPARRLVAAGCAALALTILSGAPPVLGQAANQAAAAGKDLVPQISPTIPVDIAGGAPNATLTQASYFAWQEFIALNWPAAQQNGQVQRGQADTSAKFGQAGASPLVWESFRNKVEIFQGRNTVFARPHGSDRKGTPQDPYNYSDPPLYLYTGGDIPDGIVPACTGQQPVAQAPWVNLDESSQIELDQMFAGVVDIPPSQSNSAPQLIRFLAKANQAEYDYVVKNDLWFTGGKGAITNYNARVAKWMQALQSGQPADPNTVITLPNDNVNNTIEVKSAWRPLGSGEDRTRFHMATVRYYEPGANSLPCYWQSEWALVALHIIQKTQSAPYFIFATFEQADNLLTADGTKVEDPDGNVTVPFTDPNTPHLNYQDSPTFPTVTTDPAGTFCDTPGQRLYYQELPPPASKGPAGTPVGGKICVNGRYEAIPPEVRSANAAFHTAIAQYNTANGVTSPWGYYKLVNVQAVPFNKSDIVTASDSLQQAGSFFQANIVVETDYTLQQFLARIANDQAPTAYPVQGTAPNFQNVYVAAGGHFNTYQMGGCMGCHGNAQVGGSDFSFIVGGNSFNTTPDTPVADPVKQALYLSLFGNPLPADIKK